MDTVGIQQDEKAKKAGFGPENVLLSLKNAPKIQLSCTK